MLTRKISAPTILPEDNVRNLNRKPRTNPTFNGVDERVRQFHRHPNSEPFSFCVSVVQKLVVSRIRGPTIPEFSV